MITFDQAMHLLQVVGGLAVSALAIKYGFKSAIGQFRQELAEGLKTKIDVAIYSAKVKELHDEINNLRVKLAVLEDRGNR